MTVGEAEIGVLAAGEGGEGKTDGVDEDGTETLVDIGLSVTIDPDGRVAKEMGEAVRPEVASPHPTNEKITSTTVIDCSNL